MAAAPAPITFGDFAPGEGSTAADVEEPGAEVEKPGTEVEEPGAEVGAPGAAVNLTATSAPCEEQLVSGEGGGRK